MDVHGLPQFTITALQSGGHAEETLIAGTFSSLAGLRGDRGWLYRDEDGSLIADLVDRPQAAGEIVTLSVFTKDLRPDVRVGAVFPWVDGYWQPYHIAMVLAPAERWERRKFTAAPARHFRQQGATDGSPPTLPCRRTPWTWAYARGRGIMNTANYARPTSEQPASRKDT